MLADPADNYASTFDETTLMSSQTCTAKRFLQTPNNFIHIKYGTAYKVRTGFYIYEESDPDIAVNQGVG